jgi:hypothetical protein
MLLFCVQVPPAPEEAEDAEEAQGGKRVPVPISSTSCNPAAVKRWKQQQQRAGLEVVKEQGLQAIRTGAVSVGALQFIRPGAARNYLTKAAAACLDVAGKAHKCAVGSCDHYLSYQWTRGQVPAELQRSFLNINNKPILYWRCLHCQTWEAVRRDKHIRCIRSDSAVDPAGVEGGDEQPQTDQACDSGDGVVSAGATAGACGAEAGGFADENACPNSAGCDAVPTGHPNLVCQEHKQEAALADITPGSEALESVAEMPTNNLVHHAALSDIDVDHAGGAGEESMPADGDCPSTLLADAAPAARSTQPRVRGPAKPREYALPDTLGAIVEYKEYGALDSDEEAGEWPTHL